MYIKADFARSIAKNRQGRDKIDVLDFICAEIKFLAEFGHTSNTISYPGEEVLEKLRELGYNFHIYANDDVVLIDWSYDYES